MGHEKWGRWTSLCFLDVSLRKSRSILYCIHVWVSKLTILWKSVSPFCVHLIVSFQREDIIINFHTMYSTQPMVWDWGLHESLATKHQTPWSWVLLHSGNWGNHLIDFFDKGSCCMSKHFSPKLVLGASQVKYKSPSRKPTGPPRHGPESSIQGSEWSPRDGWWKIGLQPVGVPRFFVSIMPGKKKLKKSST